MTVDELISELMDTGLRDEQVLLRVRIPGEYGSYTWATAEVEHIESKDVPPETCPTCKGVTKHTSVVLHLIGAEK